MNIYVERFNEVYMRIYSDDSGIEAELSEFFKFPVEGAKYTPRFRSGVWDGKVYLFSLVRKTLYVGLIEYLEDFAKSNNYKLIYKDQIKKRDNISFEQIQSFVESLNVHSKGKLIQPRDYQFNTIHEALIQYRLIVQSPTSCLDPETIIEVELDEAGVKFLES